jgi:hypothetical protein
MSLTLWTVGNYTKLSKWTKVTLCVEKEKKGGFKETVQTNLEVRDRVELEPALRKKDALVAQKGGAPFELVREVALNVSFELLRVGRRESVPDT